MGEPVEIKSRVSILMLLAILLTSIVPVNSAQMDDLSEDAAEEIGSEIYVYGYPLVTMEMTRRVMTNVAKPTGLKAPMGQFAHGRVYPSPAFKDVIAPNADTLYSTAWLNLSTEPYILHLPNEDDRFYLMPMLSGWTNVFANPGTRTTGNQAGDYAITGPNWKGQLPEGITEYKSPTNMVWIIGRTYTTGTQEDFKVVYALQDQYTLTPLSTYGKLYTPPKGKVDLQIDMQTPVRKQVNQMDPVTFFNLLASLLRDNPPSQNDTPIVEKMAKVGIVPGDEFDFSKLPSNIATGLSRSKNKALKMIAAQESKSGSKVNDWTFSMKTGSYGTNYLQRAYIASTGLGANLPRDAIYLVAKVDAYDHPLSGSQEYVIRFRKNEIPPVKGFWSLTMYSTDYYFIDNSLHRFSISSREKLKYNSDGSLDIYIQRKSPGKEKEPNWLPSPDEQFILMLRLYWPEESLFKGTWEPPVVQRVPLRGR